MSEDRNRDYSKYDSMTTQELEEILRLDAEAPEGRESDTELLLYVMGVLADRKKNNVTGKTAQESWESFRKNYLDEEYTEEMREPKKHRATKPWRRLIAAAAVIVLVVCIPLSAKAFGWDELWNVFAIWTKDTFSFVSGEKTQVSDPSPDDQDVYNSLQELLYENNRDPHMVPSWIPEGFVLENLEKEATPIEEIYIAFYLNGEKQLLIRVRSYLQGDPEKAEINEDLLEIYEVSGVQYYIFSNMGQMRVVWITGSYQCNISGDLSMEEMKQMIDSIGKG